MPIKEKKINAAGAAAKKHRCQIAAVNVLLEIIQLYITIRPDSAMNVINTLAAG
jgi:hypothetical protein